MGTYVIKWIQQCSNQRKWHFIQGNGAFQWLPLPLENEDFYFCKVSGMGHIVLFLCRLFSERFLPVLSGDSTWLQDECEEMKTPECPAGYAQIWAVKENNVISPKSSF